MLEWCIPHTLRCTGETLDDPRDGCHQRSRVRTLRLHQPLEDQETDAHDAASPSIVPPDLLPDVGPIEPDVIHPVELAGVEVNTNNVRVLVDVSDEEEQLTPLVPLEPVPNIAGEPFIPLVPLVITPPANIAVERNAAIQKAWCCVPTSHRLSIQRCATVPLPFSSSQSNTSHLFNMAGRSYLSSASSCSRRTSALSHRVMLCTGPWMHFVLLILMKSFGEACVCTAESAPSLIPSSTNTGMPCVLLCE